MSPKQTFASLLPLAPRMEAFDRFRHVLVLELLPEGESLGAFYRRENRFPESHGAQLGTSLGTYHFHVRKEAGAVASEGTQYQGVFPRDVPWILQYHQMLPEGVRSQSAANAQLHAVLNRYPDFPLLLDELHRNWRADTLIHGAGGSRGPPGWVPSTITTYSRPSGVKPPRPFEKTRSSGGPSALC